MPKGIGYKGSLKNPSKRTRKPVRKLKTVVRKRSRKPVRRVTKKVQRRRK